MVLVQTLKLADSGMRQSLASLFRGRHFNHSIIILCVKFTS